MWWQRGSEQLTRCDDGEDELNEVKEVEKDYESEGANGGQEDDMPTSEVVHT